MLFMLFIFFILEFSFFKKKKKKKRTNTSTEEIYLQKIKTKGIHKMPITLDLQKDPSEPKDLGKIKQDKSQYKGIKTQDKETYNVFKCWLIRSLFHF